MNPSFLALLVGCADPAPVPVAPTPPPEAAPAAPAQEAEARPTPGAPPRRPPKITRIVLKPAHPRHTDAVEADADAVDRSGEAVDFSYAWRINGAPLPEVSGPRLPPGRFKKGDRILVEVTASTPGGSSTDRSEEVTVANTVPVFKTDTRSVSTLPGTTFFAEDPDGDDLTWKLENAPRGMTISASGTVRYEGTTDEPGGTYKVAVIASDGEGFARFEVPVKVSPGSVAEKAAADAAQKAPPPRR